MVENAPPSLHEGLTYRECLIKLALEARYYGGEPVLPDDDENEHPLHWAVRLVESWQPVSIGGWRRLPHPAFKYWVGIIRCSREGIVMIGRRWKRPRDYGEADPFGAKKSAAMLADWAERTAEFVE